MNRMSRRPFSTWVLISLAALIALLTGPASGVRAEETRLQAAQEPIIASGILVPEQISHLGFLISGMAKEIPIKEGDVVEAGQVLMVLDTPELEYAVVASEAAVRSAQAYADLQRYKRVKDRRHGRVFFDLVPPEVRERADALVRQAQGSLEVSQAALAQNQLLAPYDATVVSVDVVPGEFVQQHQVVITLATMDTLQVETIDLGERDVPKVEIGSAARIRLEALDMEIGGRVIAISPIADRVGGDVVYKVTLRLDGQPERLRWGMTTEVRIER